MGSPGSSAPLLRRPGWETAGGESRPRGWGQSQGARDTHSPCPGLPTPQQHPGGGVGAAPPCPHLMLTPFATRKVCLEAQPGRGEEERRRGDVGEEAVSQLKMKRSPGSSFARVRNSPGGWERKSDPPAVRTRGAGLPAGAGPVCPPIRGLPPDPGSAPQSRVCRRARGSASVGGEAYPL